MPQPDDDAHFFESIRVEITHRMFADAVNFTDRRESFDIRAESFATLARAAQQESARVAPNVRCVITMRGLADAAFTRREHFVPEGFGFDWTAPGPGVGTCDDVNERFGRYECEWLRQGTMGFFRPFFVPEGKDGPPAYYAPTKTDRLVWFTREKGGRRTLNVSHRMKVNLPDRAGRSELTIRVPHNEARTEWVSLAVHKMALLMFWLCDGPLAFDAAFADARRFLMEPSAGTYRGYAEEMLLGASPGVELEYRLVWRPSGKGRAEIESVHCAVRVHHMRYVIALAGDQHSRPEGVAWRARTDPAEKVPDHTAFAFEIGRLERQTPGP